MNIFAASIMFLAGFAMFGFGILCVVLGIDANDGTTVLNGCTIFLSGITVTICGSRVASY